MFWLHRPPRVLIEDPDELGYRFVSDDLLAVMDASEWFRMERRALAAHERDLREAG
jgi:hypothetical protein